MDLENETTTKFFNNSNYPGIPTEKSSPGPVAGLVNVTFEPVQKGIWYTDWTRGISDSVNYYDIQDEQLDMVEMDNVYKIVWNSLLEQTFFLQKFSDKLILQSLDGAYFAEIPLPFFQEVVSSEPFDLMYSDFQLSPDGQYLYIQPNSEADKIILLSCQSK